MKIRQRLHVDDAAAELVMELLAMQMNPFVYNFARVWYPLNFFSEVIVPVPKASLVNVPMEIPSDP